MFSNMPALRENQSTQNISENKTNSFRDQKLVWIKHAWAVDSMVFRLHLSLEWRLCAFHV